MDAILMFFIIILFVLSFIGIFVPIIPGVILLWVGFFIYHFFIQADQLTVFFWIAMSLLTIVLIGSDILMNIYFIDKFGGSKMSQIGAAVGLIIGIFIYPPFGMILVPLLIVVFVELIQSKPLKEALLAALGTFIGFLSSALAKTIVQLVMIIWFMVSIIL